MRTVMALMVALGACTPSVAVNRTMSCGDLTCGDGQVCIEPKAEPDDGFVPPMCKVVSPLCIVNSCSGTDCPTCVLELCDTYPSYAEYTHLDGRILQCP